MPIFDSYIMVDWSAAGTPKRGKDSIWIAHWQGGQVDLSNPPSRAAAMAEIEALFAQARAQGRRVLAGFDFPFGYPEGFGTALDGDWQAVWSRIAREVEDGPRNANNRFDAAARLNALFPEDGPFWGNGLKRDIPGLPRKKPKLWGGAMPENLRQAERGAKGAQEVWKLSGAGSVGGQALTGIAALERLRHRVGAEVWPFETLGGGTAPVLAEIFPSLFPMAFPPDMVRDAVQVQTVARWMAGEDDAGRLAAHLEASARLPETVRRHEATILGLTPI